MWYFCVYCHTLFFNFLSFFTGRKRKQIRKLISRNESVLFAVTLTSPLQDPWQWTAPLCGPCVYRFKSTKREICSVVALSTVFFMTLTEYTELIEEFYAPVYFTRKHSIWWKFIFTDTVEKQPRSTGRIPIARMFLNIMSHAILRIIER